MFDELQKYLDDIEKNDLQGTKEFLNKLNGARRRQANAIEKAQAEIKLMRDERKYVASIKPQVKEDALKISKDILFNHALDAVRGNKEFDNELYRVPLFEAIEDNDTYLVRFTGAGFNSKISVDINLDKTAGRLNMWAAAIKVVRENLDIKVPRKNSKAFEKSALSASIGWARIYHDQGEKFESTVKARLQASAKVAPFWSIINFGTTSMASDRGGYPTPTNKATNFVNDAELEIKNSVLGFFDTARENFNSLFDYYNKFLDEELERKIRLDELVDEVRVDRNIVRRLEKTLDLNVREINRGKLEKAVDEVRKGLRNSGRVEIGSGKRKTLSVNVIKEFLVNYG